MVTEDREQHVVESPVTGFKTMLSLWLLGNISQFLDEWTVGKLIGVWKQI